MILSNLTFTGYRVTIQFTIKASYYKVHVKVHFRLCLFPFQQTQSGTKKPTEREKKRKILNDRRKELNIDHLKEDKLR